MRAEQEFAIAQARKHHAEAMAIAEEERKIRRIQLQVFVHSRFVLFSLVIIKADRVWFGRVQADVVCLERMSCDFEFLGTA